MRIFVLEQATQCIVLDQEGQEYTAMRTANRTRYMRWKIMETLMKPKIDAYNYPTTLNKNYKLIKVGY